MHTKNITRILLVLFVTVFTTNIFAALIKWEVNNATFADGGIASGSFIWDTELSTAVKWNLIVTGGDTISFPEFTWSNTIPEHFFNTVDNVLLFNNHNKVFNSRRQLRLSLSDLQDLNTPSPFLQTTTGSIYAPNGMADCFFCAPVRENDLNNMPYLSATVVPVPAAVWLFGSGLIGLVGLSRKKACNTKKS